MSVESKIDAYELLADVLFSTFDEKDIDQYVFATLRILKSFGEDILIGNVAPGYINTQISMTKKRYENVKDETLLSMDKPASNRNLSIMKTYDILARVSYIAKPSLFPYYASKWAQFCLKSKAACKQVSSKLCQCIPLCHLPINFIASELKCFHFARYRLLTHIRISIM